MWSQSRGAGGKKNQKKNSTHKTKNNVMPKHLRRTTAQIKMSGPGGEIVNARVVLNDFTAEGVELFSATPLNQGQEVSLTMEEPKRFYTKGKIVWCDRAEQSGKIISIEKFNFRVRIQFVFES